MPLRPIGAYRLSSVRSPGHRRAGDQRGAETDALDRTVGLATDHPAQRQLRDAGGTGCRRRRRSAPPARHGVGVQGGQRRDRRDRIRPTRRHRQGAERGCLAHAGGSAFAQAAQPAEATQVTPRTGPRPGRPAPSSAPMIEPAPAKSSDRPYPSKPRPAPSPPRPAPSAPRPAASEPRPITSRPRPPLAPPNNEVRLEVKPDSAPAPALAPLVAVLPDAPVRLDRALSGAEAPTIPVTRRCHRPPSARAPTRTPNRGSPGSAELAAPRTSPATPSIGHCRRPGWRPRRPARRARRDSSSGAVTRTC